MTRRIAIIGAGFSGAAVAAHLLRAGGVDLEILLINRSGWMARGLAYGTRTPTHVLNVPAGRMSAFEDDEEHFLRFARGHDPNCESHSFVPRHHYGNYLQWLLLDAQEYAAPGVRLKRLVGHVSSIRLSEDGQGAAIQLAQGELLQVDRVILALGNFAPVDPEVQDPGFYDSKLYVRDPWLPRALDDIEGQRPVLLVGTGLTMLDVALELRRRGLRAPIHAVSRHALLPQAHRGNPEPSTQKFIPAGILVGPKTIRAYTRTVREQIELLATLGVDWREVIGALRPITPALWEALNDKERRRFLRHVRPYWEVHRHRTAPALSAALANLIASRDLVIMAGTVVGYAEEAGEVRVSVRQRGASDQTVLQVAAVINCTGPHSNTQTLREPLIENLRDQGLLCPDALGLGLQTADNLALIDARGKASTILYYVGPFLKARYWESVAVPELRVHAERVAAAVHASLS